MSEAWPEVVAEAENRPNVTLLDCDELCRFSSRLVETFVADSDTVWWWSRLKAPATTVQYGDQDGIALPESLVPRQSTVILVVLDEAAEPQGAVRATIEDVAAMLRASPGFEFAITDPNLTWAIFDTHENSLVLAGRLAPASD